MLPPPLETSPPPKTSTCSDVCSCKDTCFAAVSLILLLIPGTPGAASGTTATPTGIENVGVYSAIAVFTCIDIVCE